MTDTDPPDLRSFLFSSAGKPEPGPISAIDLLDNLGCELSKLHAIEDLLCWAVGEEIPTGLPELIRGVRERAQMQLRLWHETGARTPPAKSRYLLVVLEGGLWSSGTPCRTLPEAKVKLDEFVSAEAYNQEDHEVYIIDVQSGDVEVTHRPEAS